LGGGIESVRALQFELAAPVLRSVAVVEEASLALVSARRITEIAESFAIHVEKRHGYYWAGKPKA
jgi:hypothetical protein